MKIVRFVLLTLLLMVSAERASFALTLGEAENLPVDKLAHRVLGDAGKMIIDATQPITNKSCVGFPCPPLPPGPPLLVSISFFTHAEVVPWETFGLCVAGRIDITFDENGDVSGIDKGFLYGSDAPLVYFYSAARPPTREEQSAACHAARNVKAFVAGSPNGLENVALALQDIAEEASLPARPSYTIDPCESNFSHRRKCETTKEELKWLKLSDIATVTRLSCSTGSILNPEADEPEFCYNAAFKHPDYAERGSAIWMKLFRDDKKKQFKVEEITISFGPIYH